MSCIPVKGSSLYGKILVALMCCRRSPVKQVALDICLCPSICICGDESHQRDKEAKEFLGFIFCLFMYFEQIRHHGLHQWNVVQLHKQQRQLKEVLAFIFLSFYFLSLWADQSSWDSKHFICTATHFFTRQRQLWDTSRFFILPSQSYTVMVAPSLDTGDLYCIFSCWYRN